MKTLRSISLLLAIFMLLTVAGIPAQAAAAGSGDTEASAPPDGAVVGLEMNDGSGGIVGNAVPTIYNSSKDISVPEGTVVTFYVVAAGTGTLSYQWQYRKPDTTSWINVGADSGKTAFYSLTTAARHDGYQYRCKVTGGGGSSYSKTATLHVVAVPRIVTEPKDVSARIGDSATFTVSAAGSGTLTYQWQYSKDGGETWISVSSGGNANTYTVSPVAARHLTYLYHCVVTLSGGGPVTSDSAAIKVPPEISISPAANSVNIGDPATFTSTVTGGVEPYTYRWQYRKSPEDEWTNISSGGTGADYTLASAQERHNGYQYQCIVTDADKNTSTSNTAALLINLPLKITISPSSNSVGVNDPATFTSAVTGGTPPYTYRWQYRNSSDGEWTNVSSGGTGADYTLASAQERHNGYQYRCIVTDAAKTKETSNTARLKVGADVIISLPTQTVYEGTVVTFTSAVIGMKAPYTYQWQYRTSSSGTWRDVSLNGNGPDYILTTAARHNGYQYRCIVTDAAGKQKISNTLTLNVIPTLEVRITPETISVNEGETAVFTSSVSGGTAPYTYQWQYRTSPSGAWKDVSANGTGAEYSLVTAARHNGYQYQLVVKDKSGTSVPSNTAKLYVTSIKYRALLIGQEALQPSRPWNTGDSGLMKTMLENVKGPTGASYTVTVSNNLSKSGIQDAIGTAFAGANSNDVSLFFIATEGNIGVTGSSSGALACIGSSGNWLTLHELATWLSAVPGKVIVILQSDGSGAAISANGGANAVAPCDADAFNQSVVDAFRAVDPGIPADAGQTLNPNGEFRNSKFVVLTSCAQMQRTYACTEEDAQYNYFTKDLYDAIGKSGSMPADAAYEGNHDGVVSIYELYSYIKSVGDSREIDVDGVPCYQNVQMYASDNAYGLFRR